MKNLKLFFSFLFKPLWFVKYRQYSSMKGCMAVCAMAWQGSLARLCQEFTYLGCWQKIILFRVLPLFFLISLFIFFIYLHIFLHMCVWDCVIYFHKFSVWQCWEWEHEKSELYHSLAAIKCQCRCECVYKLMCSTKNKTVLVMLKTPSNFPLLLIIEQSEEHRAAFTTHTII